MQIIGPIWCAINFFYEFSKKKKKKKSSMKGMSVSPYIQELVGHYPYFSN